MISKKLKICIMLILMLFSVLSAQTGATTLQQSDSDKHTISVAGHDNFFPIEYFNQKTKQYEGIMPEILKKISSNTDISFSYIRSDEHSQSELASANKVQIVSSYVIDSVRPYAADYVKIFSYLHQDKKINIGLAFTEAADTDLIKTIKKECAKITDEEITGYFVQYSTLSHTNKMQSAVIYLLSSFLLAIILLLIWVTIRSIRNQVKNSKMADAETGIGNLPYFEYKFEHSIADDTISQYHIAYIIIDSNYLQLYHSESTFADAVKYAASTLMSAADKNVITARITESGFIFMLKSPDENDAKKQMETLITNLNISGDTPDKDFKPIFHAAVYNLTKDDTSCETLLFNLRRNCTKTLGTNTQIVFCDSHAMNSEIEEKRLIESISKGFDNYEFKLYLQFVVNNQTKKIVSAEALSRWDNPEKGLLLPGKYIGTMESSGEISRLDFYMFEMACKQLHKWKDTKFAEISISCNFTRVTLSEDNFINRIKEISNKYVFDKSRLTIEITEDIIEKNIDLATDNVLACKNMGFTIALDDMGSGYTSLINLCDYPIDIVKIDRDILLKTDSKNGKELFKGIIALAHSLNLKVVCEGVETEDQNEFVGNTNCDYIQGWYYSKPLSVKDSEEFLLNYNQTLIC